MSSPFEVTESFANLSLVTTDAPQQELEEQTTPRQTQPSEEAFSKPRESSHSGSDTEREQDTTANMPSGPSSSKHHSSSSSSKKHSSSSSSSKHRSKSDDWSDVTEPEERRRIQNRIAQRKFREKAREQKERQERDTRNQELAGSSYSVPVPSDFMSSSEGAAGDDDLSGVPWGGLNIQHMVARGHKSASQQGGSQPQQASYGSPQQQQQQYYDYEYDYDNTTPYDSYGVRGEAGASPSLGYGGSVGGGSSSYDAATTGGGVGDDRGGQWQQQFGADVLEDEYYIDPALYEDNKEDDDNDDDDDKGDTTA